MSVTKMIAGFVFIICSVLSVQSSDSKNAHDLKYILYSFQDMCIKNKSNACEGDSYFIKQPEQVILHTSLPQQKVDITQENQKQVVK